MISFPNAKINIGLNIVSKREDGYHNLESCFYPIPLHDVLEIIPAKKFSFQSTGLPIAGDEKSNLVVKAWKLLQKDFGIEPVAIHLHKVIPMGAGLGGGSADAAFALKMMDEQFQLLLGDDYLETLALELGSDCPFFVRNQPIIAEGRGEVFSACNINLAGKHLLLLKPDIHISTKEAYAGVKPQAVQQPLNDLLQQPINEWKQHIKNDFEASLFPKYPELAKIKEHLYQMGARYASMSGSGSSMFGIFEQDLEVNDGFLSKFQYFKLKL
jgi:4-diphosphocytidyl-2-C-methyl-D-erythritol kinase